MRKVTMLMMALVLLVMTGCNGCAHTPYKRLATAYTTVNKFARFVEAFDRSVKAYLQAEDERCTKSSTAVEDGKLDQAKYGACIKPALKFSVAWTGEWKGKKTGKGVLPTIQDLQRSTRHGLDGAFDYVQANEKACGEKDGAAAKECAAKVDAWKKLIKPAVCGLLPLVDRGIKLGAFKVTEDPTYSVVKGLATSMCK